MNTDGSMDLIYASKSVTTSSDVIAVDPGKVHLQFAHLLSKVKFTFTNGFTTENTKLTVTDITMTAPKAGSINLAQEDWWTSNAWVVSQEGLVLNFGDVYNGQKLAATDVAECANECFTIPDDNTRAYTIKFNVNLYIGTYDVPALTVAREVTLTGQALKIGKKYNFKTTIGPENILPEGPLKPIEFEVIEVKEWVEEPVNPLF